MHLCRIDSFPQNIASQLQVMPGFALEAQCSEAVFKNKFIQQPPRPASHKEHQSSPAKHLLSFPPSLCEVGLVQVQ